MVLWSKICTKVRYGFLAVKARTSLFTFMGNPLTQYQTNTLLQENEGWFFGRRWMPYGFFNDLIDTNNPNEPWDIVQGASIRQLYLALGPNVDFMCGYMNTFIQQNPRFNSTDIIRIGTQHNIICP